MHIVLCGMMGCGKTTIGKQLSARLQMPWQDTDDKIVEKHGAIAEIFNRFGEARFREIETSVLKELLQNGDSVLSVGGGLVVRQENAALLKKNCVVIFLRATAETLERRLREDTSRPLLQGDTSLLERVQALLKERAPIYESVANFTVDVDEKSVGEIVEEIASIINKK